jgi:nicotinate phosphoribosyltransferase
MATGDLNEYKIRQLVQGGAPIDVFGVGTELATSADAPNLGVVYKLVELQTEAGRRYTAKFSEEKATYPGAKQVFRYADHDEITCSSESRPARIARPLLRPVILRGELTDAPPEITAIRSYSAQALTEIPAACRRLESPEPFPVEYSPALLGLAEEAHERVCGGTP